MPVKYQFQVYSFHLSFDVHSPSCVFSQVSHHTSPSSKSTSNTTHLCLHPDCVCPQRRNNNMIHIQ